MIKTGSRVRRHIWQYHPFQFWKSLNLNSTAISASHVRRVTRNCVTVAAGKAKDIERWQYCVFASVALEKWLELGAGISMPVTA